VHNKKKNVEQYLIVILMFVSFSLNLKLSPLSIGNQWCMAKSLHWNSRNRCS